MLGQCFLPNVLVFHGKRKYRLIVRLVKEGINVMNVYFRMQECLGDHLQGILPFDLNGENVSFHKTDRARLEKPCRLLGVIRDKPDDSGIGGIENGNGHDVYAFRPEHLNEVIEPTNLVLGVNYELPDGFLARVAQGGCRMVGVSHVR